MNLLTLLLPLLAALLITALVIPVSIKFARWTGMLDAPDARKVHQVPTPRLGGIGIYLGLVGGVLVAWAVRSWSGQPFSEPFVDKLASIALAASFIFLIGLVDDLVTLSSKYKLLALLGGAVLICFNGVGIEQLQIAGYAIAIDPRLACLGTGLWIATVAISINFIDGLDGLAGGLTMIAASVLGISAAAAGFPDIALVPLCLVGSLVGFLIFNCHPAKTFMGDSGSMLIGFTLASSVVLAGGTMGTLRGLVIPAVALSIPLADTATTMFRRHFLQRRSIFAAERGHIHHRLLDCGLSHSHTVLTLYTISLVVSAIAGIAFWLNGVLGWSLLLLVIPVVGTFFHAAGAFRTSDVRRALRRKRDLNRTNKHYREAFEDLQLEFHHVDGTDAWWTQVCRCAESMDIVHLTWTLPPMPADGQSKQCVWENDRDLATLPDRISVTIPLDCGDGLGRTATLRAVMAACDPLETAGARLSWFTRLVAEHSLADYADSFSSLVHAGCQTLDADDHEDERFYATEHDRSDDFRPSVGELRFALVHDYLSETSAERSTLDSLLKWCPQADVHAVSGPRRAEPDRPVIKVDVDPYQVVVSTSLRAASAVQPASHQTHCCLPQNAELGKVFPRTSVRETERPHRTLSRWRPLKSRAFRCQNDLAAELGVDCFVAVSEETLDLLRQAFPRSIIVSGASPKNDQADKTTGQSELVDALEDQIVRWTHRRWPDQNGTEPNLQHDRTPSSGHPVVT